MLLELLWTVRVLWRQASVPVAAWLLLHPMPIEVHRQIFRLIVSRSISRDSCALCFGVASIALCAVLCCVCAGVL